MVAYRSTETDLEDHFNGVPEEHQIHKAIKIEDAESSWIKVLFNDKNCQRLFTEIEKELTADVDHINQVTEEIPISSEIGISEANEDALEALQIAARAQHICRWKISRDEYPMDRVGYLKWRETLKKMHADITTDILKEVEYEDDFIKEVSILINKKLIKKNE